MVSPQSGFNQQCRMQSKFWGHRFLTGIIFMSYK